MRALQNISRAVNIFCGNLGSGKTEIAINYSLHCAENNKVSLVDLDIINPYFRSRMAKEELENSGVKLIYTPPELANADVPALSPAIKGALQTEDGYCICDVGGDDVGAVVLGGFNYLLPPERYNFYFVINTCRPFTGTVPEIVQMIASIEKASRLKVTALVNNTNLGSETKAIQVIDGLKKVHEVADQLKLPVAFTAVATSLVPEMINHGVTELLPLKFFMRTPWNKKE